MNYPINLKTGLLAFLCAVFCSTAFAQQDLSLKNYAPVAPNSAGFGAYGDIPVSYYTGTPDIALPVFSVKTNALSFPISLNYHGDGLKILGEATYVGLDWTLSNTGVITRSINAIDDMSSNGYYQHAPSTRTPGSGIDPEPDVFYYNFAGKSGKFVIDYQSGAPQGVIRFLRKEDDILVTLDANQNFNIRTEDGTAYYFTKRENQSQSITYVNYGSKISANRNCVTAWYLTSIVSTTGETIDFNYVNYTPRTIFNLTATSQSRVTNTAVFSPSPCYNQNPIQILNQETAPYNAQSSVTTNSETDEVLVDNITYNGGKVQFYYSNRIDLNNDLSAGPASKKLDQMIAYNMNNQPVKTINFSYNYFDSGTGQASYITKRLELTGFSETDNTGSQSINNYAFNYNIAGKSFPPKLDPNFEPFGYYSTDPTIGLLSQVKYPTGGSSNFTYEPHDQPIYGARIKQIVNEDAYGQTLSTKVFQYTEPNANNQPVSSGKAIAQLLYSFSTVAHKNYTCTYQSVQYLTQIDIYYTISSISNFCPMGMSILGNGFGYDQVSVLEGPNGEDGKTIYYYHNVPDTPPVDIGIPTTHDQNDGLLLKREVYQNTGSQTFSLLKSTTLNSQTRSQVVMTGANLSAVTPFTFTSYNINTQNDVLTSEDDQTINSNGTLDNLTSYTYNAGYQQPATITNTASNGKTLTTVKKYAYDMVAAGQTNPYQNMVNLNMINQLIEQDDQVNGTTIKKRINTYYQGWAANPNFILPQYVQTQKNTDPVENRIFYNNYDSYGNITNISLAGGPNVGYLWNYNGQYIVAKCVNGSDAQMYFDGFENSTASGLITGGAHTGNLCMSSPYTVNWTAPAGPPFANRYLISYWYRSTGTWNFSGEQAYNGTSYALQGGDAYDDVRIYPLGAQMTTYCYNPGVGITSITDENSKTTSYEFDTYGRLQNVKDPLGYIQKSYLYNFINQTPVWVDVAGTTRCVADQYGNNTGEQQQEQVDNNPVSATYNQIQWRSLGMTGTCPISFNITNRTTGNFTVSFQGGPSNSSFSISANTVVNEQIYPGTYTVAISPAGSPVSHTIILGNRTPVNAPGTTFYSVIIATGSSDLTLLMQ